VQYILPPQKKSRGILGRFFMGLLGLLFVLSIVMNAYLLVILAAQFEAPLATKVLREGALDEVVAVYELSGIIDGDAVERFRLFHESVGEDEDVKGILLRVESPGGGIGASDQIHAMVQSLVDANKVVVVSMGAVAASGGYYVSAPAQEIFAEPTTMTGSIGVIATWFVVDGTLEKLGAEAVVMKSTDARGWKDAISPFHRPSQREREHVQQMLDKMQQRFEDVVRKGRGHRVDEREVTYPMEVHHGDEVQTVQQTETAPYNGMVYVGAEAEDIGLVDHIGYLQDAVERVGELAGLDKPHVVRYRHKKGLLTMLAASAEASRGMALSPETLDELQTPRLMFLWKVR
jgi:protease-4